MWRGRGARAQIILWALTVVRFGGRGREKVWSFTAAYIPSQHLVSGKDDHSLCSRTCRLVRTAWGQLICQAAMAAAVPWGWGSCSQWESPQVGTEALAAERGCGRAGLSGRFTLPGAAWAPSQHGSWVQEQAFPKAGNESCSSLAAQARKLAWPHFYHILCLSCYEGDES